MSRRLLFTGEVEELTGVSFRRLNYWVVCGYVKPTVNPSGSGYQRRWSGKDVARVRQVDRAYRRASLILRQAGLPIPRWGPQL